VTAGATAQVTASVGAIAQDTDGETVVVDSVTLHNSGFVTVHDSLARGRRGVRLHPRHQRITSGRERTPTSRSRSTTR